MGLIGMARRAGAARGAYLANMEAYHRQRQGMLDDITRRRFDMDRQIFKNALADRDIKNQRDAQRFTWDQQNQQNKQTAMDLANEQTERNLQRQNDLYDRRMAAMNRMSLQDRDNYLLYGSGRYNPSLANMTQSGRRSAPSGKDKSPISDTRIENVAAHATADQMRDAFDQIYNIDEKDMRRKTGKTRDQFFKDVNDAYAEHIRTQGANAMTRPQFLEQYEKQYGFRPIHDLNKYMDARNEDAANKPSAMGNWFREYVYGKPYGTYHYEKKNPTIAGKQEKLLADIITGSGGKLNAQNIALIRNPQFVKKFMAARNNGLSPQDAVKFVLGGAR